MSENHFEQNILALYKKSGRIWLDSLPHRICHLSEKWGLSQINPVSNMNWNYVATAIQNQKGPVVLKITHEEKLFLGEYHALKHFHGHGAVEVINHDLVEHAMLLRRLIPGASLKNHRAEIKFLEIIEIYADVVKKLSMAAPPKTSAYPYMSDWLQAMDRMMDQRLKKDWVKKALNLKNQLLSENDTIYLCHGDLHLENILQDQNTWRVIDPKGVVGNLYFEASAFDLIFPEEIKNSDFEALILERTQQLANSIGLDGSKLLSWIFLRVMMSIQWFIEDSGDPSNMLILAEKIYNLLAFNKNFSNKAT